MMTHLQAIRLIPLMFITCLAGCATIWKEPLDLFITPLELDPPQQTVNNPLEGMETCARGTLKNALVGIGHLSVEKIDSFNQWRLPTHAPLQLFPRLTAPYFSSDAPGCHDFWAFPYLLWTGERYENPQGGVEAVRWNREEKVDFPNPRTYLRFWLESAKTPNDLIDLSTWQVFEVDDLVTTSILPKGSGITLDEKHVTGLVFVQCKGEVKDNKCTSSSGKDPVLFNDSPHPYYWVRAVPRFGESGGHKDIASSVMDGDLASIISNPKSFSPKQMRDLSDTIGCVGAGKIACRHPYKHFWPELAKLDSVLTRYKDNPSQRWRDRFDHAIELLYETDNSPAGVYFDEHPSEDDFSFIVAGDVQEGLKGVKDILIADETYRPLPRFNRFLELVDGRNKNHPDSDRFNQAKFIVFAGDLADADASSNLFVLFMNVLGLMPPNSPYKKEFLELSKVIRKFEKPFVAVPGNHDGYVGYHGLLNLVFTLPRSRSIDRINDYIPVIAKFRIPGKYYKWKPRYDGLQEWRYAMGPVSYAFRFRGRTFAGLNTYGLEPQERSAVGGVVFNWGGGVKVAEIDWLRTAMKTLSEGERLRKNFLFMHHDPRASFPHKGGIDQYGMYDEIENKFSLFTFGHFGLGHSPTWDVYIPVVTPAAYFAARRVDAMLAESQRDQQIWMRRTTRPSWLKVTDHYGSEEFVGLLNEYGRSQSNSPGLDALFIGHDNEPLDDKWVPKEDGVVYPEQEDQKWTGHEYHNYFGAFPVPYVKSLSRLVFKHRNDEPPNWAQKMTDEEGNFTVVRLDDIADNEKEEGNGFTLVEIQKGKTSTESICLSKPEFDCP